MSLGLSVLRDGRCSFAPILLLYVVMPGGVDTVDRHTLLVEGGMRRVPVHSYGVCAFFVANGG